MRKQNKLCALLLIVALMVSSLTTYASETTESYINENEGEKVDEIEEPVFTESDDENVILSDVEEVHLSDKKIVEFGSYPKSKVNDAEVINVLNSKTVDSDGNIEYNGDIYLKIEDGVYYVWEPIQWYVIDTRGEESTLLSKNLIDGRSMGTGFYASSWEECPMRTWLNEDFYSIAFSDEEKKGIRAVDLENDRGNSTTDKIWFLQYTDYSNNMYGFYGNSDRVCESTDYAKYKGNFYYFTRSTFTFVVSFWRGYISGTGALVSQLTGQESYGVRPAVCVDNSVLDGSTKEKEPENGNILCFTSLVNKITRNADGDITVPVEVSLTDGTEAPDNLQIIAYVNHDKKSEKRLKVKNGVIQIPLYAGEWSEGDNELSFQCTVEGYSVEDKDSTVNIHTKELSYKETLDMDLSFKFDGKLASILGLGIGATTGTVMEIDNDDGDITLSMQNTAEVNGKATTGITVQSDELKAFKSGVSSTKNLSGTNTTTMTIENFDPDLSKDEQMGAIGCFMLKGISDKIGDVTSSELDKLYYDMYGTRITSLETEKESLKFTLDVNENSTASGKLGDSSYSLTTAGAKITFSNSINKDLSSGNVTYGTSAGQKDGGILIKGDWLFGVGSVIYESSKNASSHEIQVQTNGGEVQGVSVKGETNTSDKISATSVKTTNSSKVSFKDDAAKSIVNDSDDLKNLINLKKRLFSQTDIKNAYNSLWESDYIGEYKKNKSYESGIELYVDGDVPNTKGQGIELSYSGTKKYDFEVGQGVLYKGNYYDVIDNSDNFPDGKTWNLGYSAPAMLALGVDGLSDFLNDVILYEIGKVSDGVKSNAASVWGNIKNGWNATIASVQSPLLSTKSSKSMNVLSVDEDSLEEKNSGMNTVTIGDAYSVRIYTDESQTIELTTEELLSNEPIYLSLEYTEEDIQNLGLTEEEMDKIAIFYWDVEKKLYRRLNDSEIDIDTKKVTARVIGNGEYILAVDTDEPIVTSFEVSDETENPIMLANVSDFSGISGCTLFIDDIEMINNENYKEYYDESLGLIEYKVNEPLEEGKHTASISFIDSTGNGMSKPVTIEWTVDVEKPEISEIEIPNSIGDEEKFTISVNVNDDNLKHVYVRIMDDADSAIYEMEKGDDGWYVIINSGNLNKKVEVVIIAVDEAGNKTESKPKEIIINKKDDKTSNSVKLTKIKLSGLSKQIAAGKKIKLTASVLPSNATNKAITWKSSNTKVATVTQSGVVTMKKGSGGKSVTITATAKDGSGVKATYKIKSMKGVVKKVSISGSKSVKAGKSLKLKAKVTATKSANKKLKWTSSNTKYAKVSNSGKVTTYKAGKGKKVKITAMATDGSGKKKTVTIKIK
ncbi:MAG: Ig-like domain-containing protein [Lachnospiraceae bacterium]